jgi:hypothetical protein
MKREREMFSLSVCKMYLEPWSSMRRLELDVNHPSISAKVYPRPYCGFKK